jgi:phage gp45-like
MQIGRITGAELRTNRDSDKKVLLLTVEISEPDDLQTVELMSQAGENYNPPEDSNAIIIELGEAWKVAIACDDGIEPTELAEGERELYSSSEGEKKAKATLKANGDIELNINQWEDFAVRFNWLNTGFEGLKTQINNFITTYNSHVHLYQAGPGPPPPPVASAPTLQTGSPTSAVISDAKIDNIKVGGKEPV